MSKVTVHSVPNSMWLRWAATPAAAEANLLETATLHREGAFEDGLPYLRPIPGAADPRVAAPETVVRVFRFKVDVAV